MPLTHRREGTWTYADYLAWPGDGRWELIGGEAFAMTPAPALSHQRAAGTIFAQLHAALSGSPCTPFVAPTDVVLSERDVVQPDVLVVCDRGKLEPGCVRGAPDLVVEVVSPSTAVRDRREKKLLYEAAAVKEYLVVDPDGRYLERFTLEAGSYGGGDVFGFGEEVALESLPGVTLRLAELLEPV